MTIHPRQPKDLLLAPVSAQIDHNLQRIRDHVVHDIGTDLELELNAPALRKDRDERAKLVLRQAVRHLDLHGWSAAISDDSSRLHLSGGSVSVDLGLSANLTTYIQDGVSA